MKLLLNASCSTTALLIVLLVLGCSSLTTAQAGDNTALRIGLVRFNGMDHRTGSGKAHIYWSIRQRDLVIGARIAPTALFDYTSDGKLFKT